ncbi:MAG: hypothetical protein ACREQY_21750 [Candidatus Binatia bacterium]
MYFIEDRGDDCTVKAMRTTYYAIRIERRLQLMGEAGFEKAARIDGRFFQPLLVATKPA